MLLQRGVVLIAERHDLVITPHATAGREYQTLARQVTGAVQEHLVSTEGINKYRLLSQRVCRSHDWRIRRSTGMYLDEYDDVIVGGEQYYFRASGFSTGFKLSIPPAVTMFQLQIELPGREEELLQSYEHVQAERLETPTPA